MVSEDQLSLAIGKRGQNARLTRELTGWEVDIDAEHVVTKGFEEKVAEAVAQLAAIPGITREQADALVHHGLTRLEDLLSAEASDLADIPEIGDRRGGDYGSCAGRSGAPHVEGRRRRRSIRLILWTRTGEISVVWCVLSHEGVIKAHSGRLQVRNYARSYLRHFEETWPGEQRNSRQGQGTGHCRRQGPVQLAG